MLLIADRFCDRELRNWSRTRWHYCNLMCRTLLILIIFDRSEVKHITLYKLNGLKLHIEGVIRGK
jgi:hypothetical protein